MGGSNVSIERKAIDPDDIPAPKGGRENSKWKNAVVAFLDGGNEAEEVISDADARRTATGLTTAVKAMRAEGKAKVVRRGDRVFLVRKE
jgi:hypothetical protein